MKCKKCFLTAIFLFSFGLAYSSEKDVANLEMIEGSVGILKAGTTFWIDAKKGMSLDEEDEIKTGKEASCEISFLDGSILRLEKDSKILIKKAVVDVENEIYQSTIDMALGAVVCNVAKISKKKSKFELKSPIAVVSVRGTEFVCDLKNKKTGSIGVFSGKVRVRHFTPDGTLAKKEILIKKGRQTLVKFGMKPRKPFKFTKRMANFKKKVVRLRKKAKFIRKKINLKRKKRMKLKRKKINLKRGKLKK